MSNSENTFKTTIVYYHNQLYILCWRILPCNPIVIHYYNYNRHYYNRFNML